MIAIQQSERNGKVVAATLVRARRRNPLITDKGACWCTRVAEIRELGRANAGRHAIALTMRQALGLAHRRERRPEGGDEPRPNPEEPQGKHIRPLRGRRCTATQGSALAPCQGRQRSELVRRAAQQADYESAGVRAGQHRQQRPDGAAVPARGVGWPTATRAARATQADIRSFRRERRWCAGPKWRRPAPCWRKIQRGRAGALPMLESPVSRKVPATGTPILPALMRSARPRGAVESVWRDDLIGAAAGKAPGAGPCNEVKKYHRSHGRRWRHPLNGLARDRRRRHELPWRC